MPLLLLPQEAGDASQQAVFNPPPPAMRSSAPQAHPVTVPPPLTNPLPVPQGITPPLENVPLATPVPPQEAQPLHWQEPEQSKTSPTPLISPPPFYSLTEYGQHYKVCIESSPWLSDEGCAYHLS